MAIQIQSVLFGPANVDVSFIDERHINPNGVRGQFIQINPSGFEAEIGEIAEAIEALIAAYEIKERNPPDRIPGRIG